MSRSLFLLVPWLLVSCAGTGRAPPPAPEPSPLGREFATFRAPADPGAGAATPDRPLPRGEIRLRDALAAALIANPDLATASFAVRAAEAREHQASLLPNPELAFEAEDFGGGGELSGFDALELTVAVSQEIPLAGRIEKRTDVARLEGRLAERRYERARLDVLTETTKAFVSVVSAQEMVALAEDSLRLSEEVARAVREQREAGKVSPVEERSASVALSMDAIGLARSRRDLLAARRRLCATWGGEEASIDTAEGDLDRTRPVPALEELSDRLADSPELAQWDDAIDLAHARLESARAQAWPDVTLTGGFRHFRELDTYAFLAGLSVPLPLFDRNQGGVREARAEAGRAKEERRAEEARVRTRLLDAWLALDAAEKEAAILRDDVLPSAREAFEATREGFRGGKFSHLEVLVAQRTLFEARERLVQALTTYHQAAADVERLVGLSLASLEEQNREKP